ncbi:NAD+ synthase [Solemya pervernicosa gill symbiont]|uniref:Glutamine-dependent NAD(+) synthetase n=2 Tax=Gammaproteobacteria incertae sedis TaxID=118884 RepID=A0A1T2L5Z1_9GAMM|nr:NAD+ synthase [Candidatus Reidiella endopervernicosa]OOZ40528.1 NAD+ synthase [Solemya pervernicosa gill symbiont]QKQ27514.1 NAD+ synthase [Candidatus Reidiella endopervernicosa]
MSRTLRIVLAQLNQTVGGISANCDQIIEASLRARDEFCADAILFPELTLTGYPPEDLLLRPGLHHHVERAITRIVAAVSGITVIFGHPMQTGEGLFNSATAIRDGKRLGSYHKQHLPNYSVFDEKRYFSAGRGPCLVDIAGVPVGITICEDVWMSGPVKQAAEAGARLMLNLNASPFHSGKSGEREAVARERVTESGLPLIYLNLVGGQDELVFDGGSFVMDAMGQVTMRCPDSEADLYCAELEVKAEAVTPVRGVLASEPAEVEAIYRALVLGVRDYIEKNGFRGVVLGLSGGIDSALTLAIAVDAIGKERVEAVMMPSRYTAQMSIDDAAAEAEALGIEHRAISIEPLFAQFIDSLSDEFAGLPVDTTEENIQARCRGVLLMAISNKKHKIVLTTGNKSEMSVGYATLYGDMAGGFAPIKDCPKLLVYELSRYRNSISSVIPQRVIDRPPSAELAADQKDEDSLPPYEVLDPILQSYVEDDLCAADIIALGFDADVVNRIVTLVDRNEYKRRQAPPGIRITRRAFGRDRRYPITSGYTKQQK